MLLYSDGNTRIKDLPCEMVAAHGHGLQVKVRALASRSVSYQEPMDHGAQMQWVTKEFHRGQVFTVNARQLRRAVPTASSEAPSK